MDIRFITLVEFWQLDQSLQQLQCNYCSHLKLAHSRHKIGTNEIHFQIYITNTNVCLNVYLLRGGNKGMRLISRSVEKSKDKPWKLNRDGLLQHCANRPCLLRCHEQASYAESMVMALCRLPQLLPNCQFPYTANIHKIENLPCLLKDTVSKTTRVIQIDFLKKSLITNYHANNVQSYLRKQVNSRSVETYAKKSIIKTHLLKLLYMQKHALSWKLELLQRCSI